MEGFLLELRKVLADPEKMKDEEWADHIASVSPSLRWRSMFDPAFRCASVVKRRRRSGRRRSLTAARSDRRW